MPEETKKQPEKQPGQRLFRFLKIFIAVMAAGNVVMTASWASLLGAVVILFLVWGLRQGVYGLRGPLSIVLLISAAAGLAVLGITAGAGTVRLFSGIWLGVYSLALLIAGILLWNKNLRTYLKTAPPPEEKEKKIHFFHGGWRDL